MNPYKLTLSVPRDIADEAKKYAEEQGISLSLLVTQFFQNLQTGMKKKTPRYTKGLSGVIRLPNEKSDKELILESMLERRK